MSKQQECLLQDVFYYVKICIIVKDEEIATDIRFNYIMPKYK